MYHVAPTELRPSSGAVHFTSCHSPRPAVAHGSVLLLGLARDARFRNSCAYLNSFIQVCQLTPAMPPRVLSTPRSTLMYSCLAYLSPELQAFDSIVRLHSQLTLRVHPSPCNPSRKTILSIPPELLVLIRFHLLPAVANQLCT